MSESVLFPKIFIGTLESGESEFSQCKAAIAGQKGVTIFHHVVSGLSEFEAHNALWTEWNRVKEGYQLFVKIDADTVLIGDDALLRIWTVFSTDARVSGAQVFLHDHFSDGLIAGLNAFTPVVKFTPSKSRLNADHADSNHTKIFKPKDLMHLAPIGLHAPSPGDDQSLFYGYHRALKEQTELLAQVVAAYQSKPNRSRRLALLGAFIAKIRTRGIYRWFPRAPLSKKALALSAKRIESKKNFGRILDEFISNFPRPNP